MSYQTPTPRQSRDLPPMWLAVLFALLFLAVVAAIQWLSGCDKVADEKPTITHDSLAPTYTYDGEVIRWYVFVDPDEHVQYLYNDHSWVATPRLDRNGDVMGTLDERGQ